MGLQTLAAQGQRITALTRVANVGIGGDSAIQPYRILADVLPQCRVVVAEAVVIETNLAVFVLAWPAPMTDIAVLEPSFLRNTEKVELHPPSELAGPVVHRGWRSKVVRDNEESLVTNCYRQRRIAIRLVIPGNVSMVCLRFVKNRVP